MGSPMNGEIYEGQLRAGDIGLSKEEADQLKEMEVQDRLAELKDRFRAQDEAQAAGSSGVSRPMPRYKCHKEVWALEIANIQASKPKPTIAELEALLANEGNQSVNISPSGEVLGATGATITPADEGYAPFNVDAAYIRRHDPQIGGYFVVYEDGYKSYSPRKAFQEGYVRIR